MIIKNAILHISNLGDIHLHVNKEIFEEIKKNQSAKLNIISKENGHAEIRYINLSNNIYIYLED